MSADIEVHMVADMEVDKVADMAANKNEVDICTKKKLIYARKRSRCMHENKNKVLFDEKCTRLACLLGFASLFILNLGFVGPHHNYIFVIG